MAHLPNSQIQAHSAGPIFPYVIARHEVNGEPFWKVLAPDGKEHGPFFEYDHAHTFAQACIAMRMAA
jgi:hypothetical protein